MFGTEQNSIHPTNRIRLRSSRLRRFVIAMVMLLAAVGGTRPSAAEARPASDWVSVTLEIDPDGNITMCKGETRTIIADLRVRTYRTFSIPGIGGSWVNAPNQHIFTRNSNSGAASISPGGRLTRLGPNQPHAHAEFTITASEVGTTEITFNDGGNAFTGTANDRPYAAPTTVTVTVKECQFRVVVFSQWVIPAGFQPRMTSVLGVDVIPDEHGDFHISGIPVENASWPGWSVCAHTINPTANTATLTGYVNWEDDIIQMDISYTAVTATTRITCPKVGGGTADPGQPLVLNPQPLNFAGGTQGFTRVLPHTLQAVPNGVGNSALIVQRIYLN